MEEKNKFKVVSRIYNENFSTVVFVIFNPETGELRKQVIRAKEDDEQSFEEDKREFGKVEREIMSRTAFNIKDEILRMQHGYPQSDSQHLWNHALTTAAECCNGYELEE